MLFPYAESKRILLRPATAEDGPRIYQTLFELGQTNLPLVDTFLETCNQGVAGRFLVQRRDSGEVVGFSELTKLAPAGHIQAAVHVDASPDDGIAADTAKLTVNFAFAMWRIRKVYFYTHETSLDAFGFVDDYAEMVRQEAVLPDHLYFQGQLWDMRVFAIDRAQWDSHGAALLSEIV